MLAPASTRREPVLISMFPALPVPPTLLVARPVFRGLSDRVSRYYYRVRSSDDQISAVAGTKSRGRDEGSVGDTQLTGFDSDTACISAAKKLW